MMVALKFETERLLLEEIRRGRFRSVEEAVEQAIYSLYDKNQPADTPDVSHPPQRKQSLVQLFANSPFKGTSMDFERFPDTMPSDDL